MTNEELAIRVQKQNGNGQAELWDNVKYLVKRIMSKYFSKCESMGIETDDLLQAGYFAMMSAVNDYDPDKGYKFTAYLEFHCRNKAREALGIRTSKKRFPLCGLDDIVPGTEDLKISDIIEDENAALPFEEVVEAVYQAQLRTTLDECLDTLPEKERETIKQYYFDGLTLVQIAEKRSVSVEAVRARRNKGLRTLKYSKCARKLSPFIERHIITSTAFTRSGFGSFKNTGMSSVEMAAERIERAARQYLKLPELQK